MKTPEELSALKEEVEALNKKLAELTGEELEEIAGGIAPGRPYWKNFCGQNIAKDMSEDPLNNAS